ncbi:hypothetical protein SSS_10786 [Sarcoptes scabiei]|nr:hypothetical protein SSS_10786 [Sarcoptes scabiei]
MEAIIRRLLNDCINGDEIVSYCFEHQKTGRKMSQIQLLYDSWELLPMDYLRVDAYSILPQRNSEETIRDLRTPEKFGTIVTSRSNLSELDQYRRQSNRNQNLFDRKF